MAQVENWSPEKVKAALDAQEIVLIDVRTPPEYMMGRC
ncbi:rhodanese-like domain-containing protein [Halodurantibacterium flavum]|uniref:Rhodanese-like domain-containing protein n=1 Tax=Halodurantibacterium flavum TaxID=1382802 RepID=A0ABW4S396_9RHOB